MVLITGGRNKIKSVPMVVGGGARQPRTLLGECSN